VPLYACELCGFTESAFRVDAVRAHRLQDPICPGTIHITFQVGVDQQDLTRADAWLSGRVCAAVVPGRPDAELHPSGSRNALAS
jgi:hypothetical protein